MYPLVIIAAILLLAGCGSGDEQAKPSEDKSGHIYKKQLKVLDAAKEVSEVSRELDERKRQAMGEEK